MTTIYGKLVLDPALDVEVPKFKGGGSYSAFILKYINDRNEVKEIQKPMANLKYKPSLMDTLKILKKGDDITLVMEKNEAGFLDILDLQKGRVEVTPMANAPAAATGKVVGSNYETADERKLKQRLIVRQSSIGAAIELQPKSTPEAILELAKVFEDYCYAGLEG
jgi:hypothetical protein